MNYYKITELPTQEEKLPYYTYKEDKLEKIECNLEFFMAKNLISYLGEYISDKEKFSFIYDYENEKLNSYIGINNRIDGNIINNSLYNTKFKKVKSIKQYKEYKNNRLMGSCNSILLDKVDKHLIDEIIETNQSDNFRIEFIIKKSNSISKNYREELIDKISSSSEGRSKNINNNNNIFGNFVGSDTESKKSENITEETKYKLNKHDYLILNNANNIYNLKINIYSDKEEIVNSLMKKLILYSKKNNFPTKHFLAPPLNVDESIYTTSSQIASLLAFPTKERNGLKKKEIIRFGQNISNNIEQDEKLNFAKLITNQKTNVDLGIKLNDLVRHGFISGVTGSGKTSTIKKILSEGINKKIPFLVVEPAKTEYEFFGNKIKPEILKLGFDDKFKLNPFAFPDGIHVQTHLDLLKSTFTAAFPMYGPMPYILETAILKIYQKKGWDLNSGTNIYADQLDKEKLYPTLKDLYNSIDSVSDDIGYSRDLTSDVKGALKVRIGSLMTGAKGKVLNTEEKVDINKLLKTPSILQLEQIGDNQEKNFLMGLILISIYEFYKAKGDYVENLKHLLVFEEAHRLLENVSSTENNEISNMKGKALETFTNILSEIRAYGQGILVADQIPNKLSPDVIKNTNLKIIHRLFAKDDRETVGHSIGLEDEQIKHLINLKQREAVVYFDKLDKPVKANINDASELIASGNKSAKNIKLQPEKNSYINLILENKKIESKSYKLINSLILSNEIENKVKEDLMNNYKKILKDKLDEELADMINRKILISYLEKLISNNVIDIISGYKIIEKLKNTDDLFPIFLENINNYIMSSDYKHPMDVFANKFKTICFLMKNNNKYNLRNNMKNIIFRYTQSELDYKKKLLNDLGLNTFIDINIFSQETLNDIVDSLVLYVFEFDKDILNHYFEIKKIGVDSNLLKSLKINKSNSNEKIKSSLERDLSNISESIEKISSSILDEKEDKNKEITFFEKIYNEKIIFLLVIFNIILMTYILL